MKQVHFYGKEASGKMLEGVNKISEAVKCTLGAAGRNVIIGKGAIVDYGFQRYPLHITKDGVTVARHFDVEDATEALGVQLVKECCEKTASQAGDGTTTTVVLMQAIVNKGLKLIEQGANPQELKRGIDKAVEYVVAELKKMAIPVGNDIEKIRQVATVSANNDSSIGDLIAEAFSKIGVEGVIDIEESKGVNTEIKTTDGYKFDRGWTSNLFVNNKAKETCEFENPYILLYEKRITHPKQIQVILEQVIANDNRPILIICEDADELGLAFLVMNTARGAIKACVTKSPFYGELRREAMEDIAILTGGQYVSSSKGLDIDKLPIECLGQADKVIVSKEETIIIGGKGNKEDIDAYVADLKMNLTQAKSDDEKDVIEKHIAKLTSGVAVIHVGAATETEMKEKKDRVDDAIRATKAAIAEGYVSGGGSVFIRLSKIINPHDKGSSVVIESLESPFNQICANAGVDSNFILESLSENWILGNEVGYNAKENKIENLIESGVIDPVKVLRCSLQNAASSAGMFLLCHCSISDVY